MAYLTDCICRTCGGGWRGMASAGSRIPDECDSCYKLRVDRERREYFGALDALTVEERLRRVEEWIYNYKPSKSGPAVYG